MEESVRVDNLCCSLWILVVTLHCVVTAVTHLTLNSYRTLLTGLRIDNLHFSELVVPTYSRTTHLKRIVDTGLCHTWGRLCKSVHTGNLHEHLLLHPSHKLDRTKRSGHNTDAEARHVEHIEHRMVKLGDEHCRHTIE